MQKGNISIESENIFPIIKQFLYTDQEIFIRELVSNAMDATSKLRTLASKGEFKEELGDLTIEIKLDTKKKTLTISDNGIGMTEEEVMKYLNQMALSSAQEFLDKYKDESNIIGHFGLGFYSSFMVSDKVEVHTKSYKGDEAVVWSCKGDPTYELKKGDRTKRGTDIILHISDESKEYLKESKIQELLDKYCRFLPTPIKFGTNTETVYEGEGDEKKEKEVVTDNIVNNTNPLWKRNPNDITDEEYKAFYNELYPYSQPPMFWIHLNIDFPFNLTGILYFPKIGNALEVQKNKIQLYSNQVFVTDDVKEIVPEFLTLLHGVIDSPDIPLNVSRSALQSDANVKKITGHITKKVADKLKSIFKKDRPGYEEKWDDLNVFVKYGLVSDEKFYKKAEKFVLLKNTKSEFFTHEEYTEKFKENQTDKNDKFIILYTNNKEDHDSYIKSAENFGYDVLVLDSIIDNHFIQNMETKLQNVSFVRVDSNTVDKIIQKDTKIESVLNEKQTEKVLSIFKEQITDSSASISVEALSEDDLPVIITKNEFMRRMGEMQAMQGMGMGAFPESYNVVINANNPLIAEKLTKLRSEEKKKDFSQYLYDLARINMGMLKGADMTKFIKQSIEFLK